MYYNSQLLPHFQTEKGEIMKNVISGKLIAQHFLALLLYFDLMD